MFRTTLFYITISYDFPDEGMIIIKKEFQVQQVGISYALNQLNSFPRANRIAPE